MTINRGGDLSGDYFRAYFNLVMNSRNIEVGPAREFIYCTFFKCEKNHLGNVTYRRFEETYYELMAQSIREQVR